MSILVTTIPEADKMSELDLKYLFMETMPSQWRYHFQEIGKKARSEPLFDELTQLFDLIHNSEKSIRKYLGLQESKGNHI